MTVACFRQRRADRRRSCASYPRYARNRATLNLGSYNSVHATVPLAPALASSLGRLRGNGRCLYPADL